MDGRPNLAGDFSNERLAARLSLAISIDWWTARLQSTAVYSIQYARDKPREDLFLKDKDQKDLEWILGSPVQPHRHPAWVIIRKRKGFLVAVWMKCPLAM